MQTDPQDSAVLQAILEAAVDAMIVSDETGTILRANPAALDLFQYARAEMLGQNVDMLMPQALAYRHHAFMKHHIDSGETSIIGIGREVEGLRKDGTVFPLHLSVGKADVHKRQLFVGIMHDLTHQRATQEALARAQRLDAIGQMTGGIAHDFNNLLTVIIGNLELLEMRTADPRQAPLIKDALEASNLGADLTKRLLVFARKGQLKPAKADLRHLCEDTLAILRRTLGSNYTITTQYGADLSPVMIDAVQLQSALMNLAINARDAMGEKGRLLISLENVRIDDTYMARETDIAPGDYVRLSISDDGAGMTAEAQRRAFEPFFTTKQLGGGTGLGLAMVYGFVRQSGGNITLYSELGLGTSFGLYFPALAQAAPTRDAPLRDMDASTAPWGHGKIVMVVEDNPKVRQLSIERIRDLGFETIEAANADDAYQMLTSGVRADIVFSDLVMPGALNGYDLAAKIAAEFPAIKILLTSGYASDVLSKALAHAQSYDILHKPYRQSDLALRLHSLVGSGPPDCAV